MPLLTDKVKLNSTGVDGLSDVSNWYDFGDGSNIGDQAVHFNRTNFLYVQSSTKVHVFNKTTKESSTTNIPGLVNIDFISDTLAVGITNSGIFKIAVSGSTLTPGTVTDLEQTTPLVGGSGGLNRSSLNFVVGLSSTQAAVLCQYSTTDNFFYYSFAAVNISGSTPSVGAVTTIYAGGQYQSIQWRGHTKRNGNQFIAAGVHGSSNGQSKVFLLAANGTTISHNELASGSANTTGVGRQSNSYLHPQNEGRKLDFVPVAGDSSGGTFAAPYFQGYYPNILAVTFTDTTTAAGFSTMSSRGGSPQSNRNWFSSLTPFTTTENNGYYFLFRFTNTGSNTRLERYGARIERTSSTSVSINWSSNTRSDPTFASATNHPAVPIGNDKINEFHFDRSSSTATPSAKIRKWTITTPGTSNWNLSNTIEQNDLPNSSSAPNEFCMSNIGTQPLIKGDYEYLFETDVYTKSNDNWDTYIPGRISAFIPYTTHSSIRVIDDDFALVFSSVGTKIQEMR